MPVTNYYSANNRLLGESLSGVVTTYMTDALGSTIGTIRGGTVRNRYVHKPYGGQLQRSGQDPDPSFLWVGGAGYRATGRNFADEYVRQRHYSFSNSQWASLDGLWPRVPAYSYSSSNPCTHDDPSGRYSGIYGEDCCDTCADWYVQNLSHCPGGWGECPSLASAQAGCKGIEKGSADCATLLGYLQGVASACVGMCSGSGTGGYGPGDPWAAATCCCVKDGKSKFCSTMCCTAALSGSNLKGPAGQCNLACLLVHESKHKAECDKYPPVNGQPPYDECCAYYSQMQCLLGYYTSFCGYGELPPEVGKCIKYALSKSQNCASR